MPRILRSKTAWIAISLSIVYWLMAFIVPLDVTLQTLNWVLVAVAVTVTVAYTPTAIDALASSRPDRVEQLVLGIICAWVATIGLRIWTGIWRFLDQPDWMQESRLLGFFIYISILGGVLHITAPGSTNVAIPKKNWLMLLFAILSGGLVAGFVIGWKLGPTIAGLP